MPKEHRIFPHGAPELLQPGLWRVVGSLPYPLKRNMLIYRLPDGDLLLYSVVAMDEAGMTALEKLGRPKVMVIPHPLHIMDAAFYKQRYPEIRVIGCPDAQARLPQIKFDASPEEGLPPLGIMFHLVPGLKFSEIVLELPLGTSRALIVTDLLFGRYENKPNFLMKMLGPPGGSGVARIVKLRQVADKEKVRDFIRRIANTPSLGLIASGHGGCITQDCTPWLRNAADRL